MLQRRSVRPSQHVIELHEMFIADYFTGASVQLEYVSHNINPAKF